MKKILLIIGLLSVGQPAIASAFTLKTVAKTAAKGVAVVAGIHGAVIGANLIAIAREEYADPDHVYHLHYSDLMKLGDLNKSKKLDKELGDECSSEDESFMMLGSSASTYAIFAGLETCRPLHDPKLSDIKLTHLLLGIGGAIAANYCACLTNTYVYNPTSPEALCKKEEIATFRKKLTAAEERFSRNKELELKKLELRELELIEELRKPREKNEENQRIIGEAFEEYCRLQKSKEIINK